MSYTVKEILKMQVAPALGCTEPVAIALGAAAAASLLETGRDRLDSIEVWVDPNIYKNGLAVSIPGTDGLSGLDTAAALGALGGDPALRLEVLDPIDPAAVVRARSFLAEGRVSVNLLADRQGLFIRTLVRGGAHSAESVIRDLHDNIIELRRDNEPVADSPLLSTGGKGGSRDGVAGMESWLKDRSLSDLLNLVDQLDTDDRTILRIMLEKKFKRV